MVLAILAMAVAAAVESHRLASLHTCGGAAGPARGGGVADRGHSDGLTCSLSIFWQVCAAMRAANLPAQQSPPPCIGPSVE
jgi:hypothetical protein